MGQGGVISPPVTDEDIRALGEGAGVEVARGAVDRRTLVEADVIESGANRRFELGTSCLVESVPSTSQIINLLLRFATNGREVLSRGPALSPLQALLLDELLHRLVADGAL
jgi:hypothetical protein